jgi:hypothetical protein
VEPKITSRDDDTAGVKASGVCALAMLTRNRNPMKGGSILETTVVIFGNLEVE